MTIRGRLLWALIALLTIGGALATDLVRLPEPNGALRLTHAVLYSGKAPAQTVILPNAILSGRSNSAAIVRYEVSFQRPAAMDAPLFLYIPTVNRRVAVAINGQPLLSFTSNPLWTGPLISGPLMVPLPRQTLVDGNNRLTLAPEVRERVMPTYLSAIYIGPDSALARPFFLHNLLGVQLKTMAVAAQLLLSFGLLFAYFFSPRTPLYSWMSALLVTSLAMTLEMFVGWQPYLQPYLTAAAALMPAVGLMLFGIALALVDIAPPRWLRLAVFASIGLLLPVALIDNRATMPFLAPLGAFCILIGNIVAAAVVAWGALWRGRPDARLMLVPFFLMAWYIVRDAFVTATIPAHGFQLLFPYARTLFLACLIAVLMRRMGLSLKQLDSANETLAARLSQREAELNALYRKERVKADHHAKEQERQRITQDLHDGISGHLASIVALSERTGEQAIEKAARQALNDLRLVIYSLDLGDRELPLALANFRDRLAPQLHHLGVALEWSVAGLPEVSGLTPGSALMILRILQEAITNAVKHGPARRIEIKGAAAGNGMVAITVENDGRPFVRTSSGYGMASMERRAQQIGGKLTFETIPDGVRLTLFLPSNLPELDQAVSVQELTDAI